MTATALVFDGSIVEAGTDEAGFAFIACPAPYAFWTSNGLARCPSRALLRASNGSLWMLDRLGRPWTRAHLQAADARICGSRPATWTEIADDLGAGFGDRSVTLAPPRAFDVDRLWATRSIAVALADAGAAALGSAPGIAAEPPPFRLQQRLRAELVSALHALRQTLDAQIAGLATRPCFDPSVYNWLLRDPQGRRRQFARAFPVLLPLAVSPHREGRALEQRVDDSATLVEFLAARWRVRPAAIRALGTARGMAALWRNDPRGLAATLDALPAERWPRDAADWDRFDALAAAAMREISPMPWESTLAMAWLRDALAAQRDLRPADAQWQRLREGVAPVKQLRDALAQQLAASLRRRCRATGDRLAVAAAVADRHLLGMSPAEQLAMARRYREDVLRRAGCVDLADRIVRVGSGRGWPLLPEAQVTADGARRMVPIDSRGELRRFGQLFENCLRGPHLEDYAADMRDGAAFFVALIDAASGAPCSLAEYRVARESRRRIRLALAQHQTAGNRQPPAAPCRSAIAELERLIDTPAVQQHLQRGLFTLGARATAADVEKASIVHGAVGEALCTAIGARGLSSLARRLAALAHARWPTPGARQLALPL